MVKRILLSILYGLIQGLFVFGVAVMLVVLYYQTVGALRDTIIPDWALALISVCCVVVCIYTIFIIFAVTLPKGDLSPEKFVKSLRK